MLKIDLTRDSQGFVLFAENDLGVRIPCTLDGLRLVKQILEAQRVERRGAFGKTGSPQAPIQHMVDEWLKTRRPTHAPADLTLADLGL